MKIEQMSVDELIPYHSNPRFNEQAVDKVAASIKEFGFKVPIVVDKDNVIVAGHTRLRASQLLNLETVPVLRADDLTEEQVQAYRLADNKTAEFAEWDTELLEQELDELTLDMEQFGFEDLEIELDPYDIPAEDKGSLVEQFIVPPFSVLDTKQGYWQDRKREWLVKTGNLSESRDGEFGKMTAGNDDFITSINGGTSNFDPVLAEIMYKWFCIEGGKVIDPFGGEATKGVVAGELGYGYKAIEIRQEQIDVNNLVIAEYDNVEYIRGDSNDIGELITEDEFDLCFTSPPYYDLEVYSKEDLSSLGTYEEFMQQYENIFKQTVAKLKNGAFLVIKVGDIRNKKTGEYRGFVSDNIDMFKRLGLQFYNDIVLLNSPGTAPLRAGMAMNTRKMIKIHQNVLVFYKGDLDTIKDRYPKLDFSALGEDDID